jgi:UDP-glucose:(heptosyl)LPS alpha-1,3-glucosyltransferase
MSKPIQKTKPAKLDLVHVVRRYGPVGGMERYVWELTLQLQKFGHHVTVICERCHADKPIGITVVELGEIIQRPRWLSALRFDRHAVQWLAANPQSGSLIHSHERISSHDITTFHSPPFATVFEKPWWRLISLRVVMHLFMEKRELRKARSIVPNSYRIQQQLMQYYPEFEHKLTQPISPGVTANALRVPHTIPDNGGVIGFVGKEWKRKGLVKAIAVAKQLRLARPNMQFVVVGPNAKDVQHLFADWQCGYVLKGWLDQADFTEFDVLLHPANAEPYGMCISEAMAAQVPVVISDVCGSAIHVAPTAGQVISCNAPISEWVEAVECQLSRTESVPQFERSWRKVAQEYENRWYAMENESDSLSVNEFGLNGISFTH